MDRTIGIIITALTLLTIGVVIALNMSKKDNYLVRTTSNKKIEVKPIDMLSIYKKYLADRSNAELECFAHSILVALGRSGSGRLSSTQLARIAQNAYLECMKEKGFLIR